MAKKESAPKKSKKESFIARSAKRKVASDASLVGKLPKDLLQNYEVHEWKHAAAILATDYPAELDDIVAVLRGTRILKSHIIVGGGGKTKLAQSIDAAFRARGWIEKRWDTKIVVDQRESASPTHAVDCFKNT